MRTKFIPVLILTLISIFSITIFASDPKKAEAEAPSKEKPAEITWISYDDGLKKAEEQDKHILVNFTTSWCHFCKVMNRTTFKETEVVKLINDNFIAIKVDGDSKKELDIDGYKITERNLSVGEFGVKGYPTYWFLKPGGDRLGKLSGYQKADAFAEILFFLKEKLYDKMTFDEFMKAGGRKEFNKG